jgi:hypothetical protein
MDSDSKKSSKKREKVVVPKKLYFIPSAMKSVEAASVQEATEIIKGDKESE